MSNGIADLSGQHNFTFYIPAAMASATTDDEFPIFVVGSTVVPTTGITLIGAKWTPTAAVTHNASNYSVLSIRNRTSAFAGTALPFSRSYVATDSSQGVPEAMTASATAADLVCANGDVLTVQRLHTSSGVVIPAGLLHVTFTLR